MDLQTPLIPNPELQEPVDPPVAEVAGTPPPPQKKDSFIMSFISPKRDIIKFLPVFLVLFLVAALPLAVFLVKSRQVGETQAGPDSNQCECESATVSKDRNNINMGDQVTFTGFGRINYAGNIDRIKLTITKNEEVIKEEESDASLDREEEGWRFYKSEDLIYTIEEDGNYEVVVQVHCPDGWKD